MKDPDIKQTRAQNLSEFSRYQFMIVRIIENVPVYEDTGYHKEGQHRGTGIWQSGVFCSPELDKVYLGYFDPKNW